MNKSELLSFTTFAAGFLSLFLADFVFADEGDAECKKPAYMVVESYITDPDKLKEYGKALRASNLYPENQGYYIVVGRPAEVFEGGYAENRTLIVAKFPCLAKAKEFWYSDKYEKLKPLREGAGTFNVQVYEEAPIPDYAR